MQKYYTLLALCMLTQHALSQSPNKHYNYLGGSFQWYPAGIILNGIYEHGFSINNSWVLRAGVNLTNRKDFSEYNDNERGAGFGVSAGYRHYFPLRTGKLLAGINNDIWNMWINWKNDTGGVGETSGTTYTLVLQPWLELGYAYAIPHRPLQINFSTGFGREINTITAGNEVGQGWMNSVLLSISWNLGHR